MAGEFFRGERRPGRGRGGGQVRWGVHGQVDHHPGVHAADDHPAESVTVMDPLGDPASLAGSGFQGIACGRNIAALWGREEVEVLGGPRREVLCKQRCSPGQQKAIACGQCEEQPRDLHLERRQLRLDATRCHHAAAPPDGETSGAQADRTARGRTRSSHRSMSSAPST